MSEESQTETRFKPAAEFIVKDLETLKVLSDPLRIQILEHMGEPHTVKQISKELGIAPTKLYYHVNMLEEHGLISVTDTRVVSGILEKRYQLSAWRFRLAKELVTLSGAEAEQGVEAMLSSIFDLTKADIIASIHAGLIDMSELEDSDPRWKVGRSLWAMTPEKATAFYKAFEELISKFGNEGDSLDNIQPDEQVYAMTYALYPTTYVPNKEEKDEQPE
ncbi:MAG: hypothetical protein DLM69_12225 [Candidatus Chloroheliales bacterium]|nr:MAG: hypothetical protein DLM69_12225 [Chloroflexota bacterium]